MTAVITSMPPLEFIIATSVQEMGELTVHSWAGRIELLKFSTMCSKSSSKLFPVTIQVCS